jgi:hypothetical protein
MSQRDKPRQALNNITAGVREREDANRTEVAGHLDEMANTLRVFRDEAVGFIEWLDAVGVRTAFVGLAWRRSVDGVAPESRSHQ